LVIRTVGVVAHPRRPYDEVFDAIVAWAGGCGGRLVTLDGAARLPGAAEVLPPEQFAEAADVVIAAGGDGTVLHALAVAAPARVPVLGVNLGRLGFLAELDPPELPRALAAINADEFTVEERLALDVEMTSSDITARFRASNDVVLNRVPGRGQAEFAASVDGELFARYVGDGLIVATPTGATAYNLSAGGPIVSPSSEVMLLTALAPHGIFNRTLVVATTERLTIDVLDDSAPVVVECDGGRFADAGPGARLTVSRSDEPGLLIRLGWTSFYTRARRKLRLTDPPALNPP
jgi:NAD+ kinase